MKLKEEVKREKEDRELFRFSTFFRRGVRLMVGGGRVAMTALSEEVV